MYDIENYYNAKTIEEAVSLLKAHPDARIISGGSDVLIKIREGKMAGTSLVCIRDIPQLKGVKRLESGDISIGAGTTFSHITNDPVIQRYIPALGEAVDQVGGPQVRNIGTIGGNICNGAVSADSAPTVFSLNALLRIEDGEGGRTVPVRDFYLGPGRVDLKQGDVLTHVIIPAKEYQGYHGHYVKYSMRNAMDIATLSCSVVSKVNLQENILEDVRITFGVAAPVPFRCVQTEEALKGKSLCSELYEKAAELVRLEINPRDSWRASREFRLQIGGEIARRALLHTVEQAQKASGMGMSVTQAKTQPGGGQL
ncbi:MAG: xanthine dehydrogenase FAD-binding subunit XdhB [Eubacteriales bacterium]|nr:xanthine dehydrogenase FAD-binding subunit XdhB [Eubacteriales bacterium]